MSIKDQKTGGLVLTNCKISNNAFTNIALIKTTFALHLIYTEFNGNTLSSSKRMSLISVEEASLQELTVTNNVDLGQNSTFLKVYNDLLMNKVDFNNNKFGVAIYSFGDVLLNSVNFTNFDCEFCYILKSQYASSIQIQTINVKDITTTTSLILISQL